MTKTYRIIFYKGEKSTTLLTNEDAPTDTVKSGEVRWVDINGDKYYMPQTFSYSVHELPKNPIYRRLERVFLSKGPVYSLTGNVNKQTTEDQIVVVDDIEFDDIKNKFFYILTDCTVPGVAFKVRVQVEEDRIGKIK